MISPQERQTSNRRKNLQKVYRSKEWKNNVKEFLKGKKCEWCGSKEKLLPHHPHLESYKDGTYGDLYLSNCMVMCNRCHFALHKGLILCPVCHTRYTLVGSNGCRSCFDAAHPELVAERERRKYEQEQKKRDLKKEKNERDRAFRKSLKKTVNSVNTPKPIRDWDGCIFPDA